MRCKVKYSLKFGGMMFRKTICVLLAVISLLCFSSALNIKPRIINGVSSSRTQFPFYVWLDLRNNSRTIKSCGGVLIEKNWVLTAAHCLFEVDELSAHLGAWKVRGWGETGRKVYLARKDHFHIHPDYDKPTIQNDIALIKLPKEAPINEFIQTVYWPHLRTMPLGIDVIAIGSGYIDNEKNSPKDLQYATLRTVDPSKCKQIYSSIDKNKVFCAQGFENEAICQGDSGGPIIHAFQQTLMGITSFTHSSGCLEHPQGFVNIIAYSEWMAEVIGYDLNHSS